MAKQGGFVVIGTDTGVGKTLVSLGLLRCFRSWNLQIRAVKPLESGGQADAQALADLEGRPLEKVLMRSLKEPMAPLSAARREGLKIKKEAVLNFIFQDNQPVLVEGAGGLLVPYCEDGLLADLIKESGLPVLVVARAGLGTVNHSLLTVEALRARAIPCLGLVLNGARGEDATEGLNADLLEEFGDVSVLAELPWLGDTSESTLDLSQQAEKHLGTDRLKEILSAAVAGQEIESKFQPLKTDLEDLDRKRVWHPFTAMKEYEEEIPIIIESAEGSYLTDIHGKKYLDGVSSLWVALHGHRHPLIDNAIRTQLEKVSHSTLLGMANVPSVLLADQLVQRTPKGLSRVFYSDSGSEAVEIALKMAFQYWKNKGEDRPLFVAPGDAYHGDTVGAVSIGGIEQFHEVFRPLLFEVKRTAAPYCYRCPLAKTYPDCGIACAEEVDKVLAENKGRVSAFVIEPAMQGAAGMQALPQGYLGRVREICTQRGVLLVADEVAVGFGRTGTLFACEQEDVAPDLLALAKGLSGGVLPLGATLATEEIYSAFLADPSAGKTFFHGHTYTGNQLGCAAALASLEIFDSEDTLKGVVERAKLMEKLMADLILPLKGVGDIRQRGLMAGIELVADKKTRRAFPSEKRMGRQVCLKTRERGVLIRPLGDVVVLVPPLNIDFKDLELLVESVAYGIREILK